MSIQDSKQAEPLKTGMAELKKLESMPVPEFSNFGKATQVELAEHVQDLRLWCGQVVMVIHDLESRLSHVGRIGWYDNNNEWHEGLMPIEEEGTE